MSSCLVPQEIFLLEKLDADYTVMDLAPRIEVAGDWP